MLPTFVLPIMLVIIVVLIELIKNEKNNLYKNSCAYVNNRFDKLKKATKMLRL